MSTENVSLRSGAAGAPIISERLAAADGILPGHLLIEALGLVQVNNVASTAAQKLFAQKNIASAGTLEHEYIESETVRYGAYHAGQEVSAIVAAGAGAIVDGNALTSAGDGTLIVGDATNAVAYALEDVDNSAETEIARIKTRVA